MPKQKRKAAKKVAKRKTAPKKKTAKKKPAMNASAYNRAVYYKAYQNLQQQVDKAWKKFCSDKKRKASASVLAEDHKNLLLLLGECNYFARECMRLAEKK